MYAKDYFTLKQKAAWQSMASLRVGDRLRIVNFVSGIIILGLASALGGCATTGKQYAAAPHRPAAKEKPLDVGKEARLRVARSFQDAGDYASALRLYQQAIAEDPKNVEALVGIGGLYAKLKAFDAARQSFDQALAAAPNNGEALAGMGQVLINQGDAEAALDYFTRAAAADPKNPRVFNGLGLANDLLGHHEEAQVSYGRGLDHAAGDRALLNNLALSFMLSKNYETAIRILSGLATADQAGEDSRQNLAMAYGLSGDFASAEKLLALDLTPDQIKGRLYYFRRLQTASPEAQTKALFLGVEPAPVIAQETEVKPVAMPEVKPEARPEMAAEAAPEAPAKAQAVEAAEKPAPAVAKAAPRLKPAAKAPKPVSPAPKAAPKQPEQAAKQPEQAAKRYSVQLGSYKSEAFALLSFRKLTKAHDDLLHGFSAAVTQVDLGEGGIGYRLYIREITGRAAAEALCGNMQAQKLDCLVRQFPPEAPASPENKN
jgi:Flp pilus assembly protein TadD